MATSDIPARGFEGLKSVHDSKHKQDEVKVYQGKVRDVVDLGDKLLMVTTDRISAFDIIWGMVPGKGEILNALTVHWLNNAKSILPTAFLDSPTPHSQLVKKAQVLPVEMIVRGYITGSAWRAYSSGKGWPGIDFPQGLKENQKLDSPILTPTTKAEQGEHDEAISEKDILEKGLIAPEHWETMKAAALALFDLGTKELAHQGLILVDTKYEFGLIDGQVVLIDEVHTPDSSRFWYAEDYLPRFQAGESPRKLDKEFFRAWLLEQGFDPEKGQPFPIPDAVLSELRQRYEEAYQVITGNEMTYSSLNFQAEIQKLQSLM
jgi:phosphoribosylaminoimidazole-succinocarboxamide synthase